MNYQEIKLEAKAQGKRVKDLIALAPQNDPFYVGAKSDLAKAQWFVGLWEQFGYETGVHLRRIHYQAASLEVILKPNGKPYENTKNDWGYIQAAAKCARYLGLIPADRFIDKRNPAAILHTNWSSPGDYWYESPEPGYELSDSESWSERMLPELPELPELLSAPKLPDFGTSGYTSVQQDFHVEIWAEKTTMNDILEPLCKKYRLNLITGAGELSITAVTDFLERVRKADRPARIFYVSDFDPAGLGMPISVARKIEFFQREEGFDDLDIRLQPAVLTAEQVAEYSLPRKPVDDKDRRKANWEAAHGKGRVELDALEGLYPGKLAEILTAEILNYFDSTLHNRAWNAKCKLQDLLSDEHGTVISWHQTEIDDLESDYESLRDDFLKTCTRFAEMIASFQPEIDAYSERLEAIKARGTDLHGEILGDLEAVDVIMPDLPTPELPQEANGTLYISDREYFDQIEYYQAYRSGN